MANGGPVDPPPGNPPPGPSAADPRKDRAALYARLAKLKEEEAAVYRELAALE